MKQCKQRTGVGRLVAILQVMRSINWLESTSRQILGKFPEIRSKNAYYIAERLSTLLLERLPADQSEELIALLPDYITSPNTLYRGLLTAARAQPDFVVGYPDFVDQVSRSFLENITPVETEFPEAAGISTASSAVINRSADNFEEQEYYEKIADAFLWAIAEEIPVDLKSRMTEVLPVDIRSRMNLYSGGMEESKVA
jgi:hypothetical protein